MSRIPKVDHAATTGRARTILDGVVAKRGRAPSMMCVLANSPAAAGAYVSFGNALGQGVLPAALRERVAIAVASVNHCETCLAAHTHFGRGEGIPEAELDAARQGESADPRFALALRFALEVLRSTGHVPDALLAEMRAAGFGDDAMLEITATVYVNVFTNAVNHLGGTQPDDWSAPP